MFPTRINVGQLLLTFGRYVAIGAVEGLPEKHTPVHKYILGVTFEEIVKEFFGEEEEVCDESTSEYQNT